MRSFLLLLLPFLLLSCSQNPHVDVSTPPESAKATTPIVEAQDKSPTGDRDRDGVPDSADKCPDTAGPADNNGCPLDKDQDYDGDGVLDTDDRCPAEPGPASSDGCPQAQGDRDRDFVPDHDDSCPDVPGQVYNDGCPIGAEPDGDFDSDRDGVPDKDDRCMFEPGSARNDGCPVPRRRGERDSDHDGIPDSRDACPLEPGPACGQGCALPKEEERRVLLDVKISLKFDFDRATIRPESFPALDRLVGFLRRHPGARLKMVGHTDDVGTDEYNMGLSEARVVAVRDYLAERGIGARRLNAFFYGEREPLVEVEGLDGEELEAARFRNRRVDMSVRYEASGRR